MAVADLTLLDSLTQALSHEMTIDDNVVVFGEDVGKNGGVFRVTQGLQQRFGKQRVLDTPLAEAMIAGLAVGMAGQGLKPVCEFQFMGFIYPALNQLICHAARIRNRSRGRLSCPAVFRAPFGGGIHAPEHHSESTEALFTHIPGLKVVIPSSPRRAYGLLLAAIRDPDPVIFLEPKRIYRMVKQPVPDDGQALPIGKAFTLRQGSDMTLLTWGACVHECSQVAKQLADNIDCELIDVGTLKPIDWQTILTSVEKTGRCVIVHEAALTGGVGADLSATIHEQCFGLLAAPVRRVTGYDITMPYFKREQAYLPSLQRIEQAIIDLMEESE